MPLAESGVGGFAIRNQISHKIEDLPLFEGVQDASGHVGDQGEGALLYICFADGDTLIGRSEGAHYDHSFVLTLNPAREYFAAFRFDLSRRITFGDHLRR